MGDPAYDHIKECSPCYLEGRAIQEADALVRRRKVLTWAAAVVLVFAGATAWKITIESGTSDTERQAQLDLRPHAITRGETQVAERPPLKLQHGRLALTMLLPTGSEPGPYEVEIRDAAAVSRVSARGHAARRNQVTTVDIALDVRALVVGEYQLAIRRSGEDWQVFPLEVR